MAWYPNVIATMWSISDVDAGGPEVTGWVHAGLSEDDMMSLGGQQTPLHKAAAGLHERMGGISFKR